MNAIVRALSVAGLVFLAWTFSLIIDRTLVGFAEIDFMEEFLLFSATKSAKGSCISSHLFLLCQIRRVLRGRQPL